MNPAPRRLIGLITARGGSKGVPRKNVRDVGGRPLIEWTIEAARNSCVQDVVVSTDDEEIASISRAAGAAVPFMRPLELALDDTQHDSVLLHAVEQLWAGDVHASDYIVLLQPTSPLRAAFDIDAAITMAIDRDADCVVSVCEPTHNPAFCLDVREDDEVLPPVWNGTDVRRQAFDRKLVPNGAVYVIRVEAFANTGSCWSGATYAYRMPVSRSLDIDTLFDLHLADLLLMRPFDSDDRG